MMYEMTINEMLNNGATLEELYKFAQVSEEEQAEGWD